MDKKEKNPFVSFYGKHNISPVHQDISVFNVHMIRREKLYRKLGLPPALFSNKTILEVGPGGGYNALAFFKWGANVDFIEPNPKAQEELPELFYEHGIHNERWNLFKGTVEDYPDMRKYDVVVAEGFIPGLYNISEVISKISKLVSEGGVAVVTCVDDISYFFEHLKRLIATRLTENVDDFNEKINILVKAFSSHLKTLKGASRPVEDWVTDNFLNPAIYADFFSIKDCILEFGPQFEILGSSPDMFIDYSWYKDLDFADRDNIIKQFERKRHTLLLWDLEETIRSAEDNEKLFKLVFELRRFAGQVDNISKNTDKIIDYLKQISCLSADIDNRIPEAISESIILLSDSNLEPEKVARAAKLAAAFGRGQQYVSMVKRFTD